MGDDALFTIGEITGVHGLKGYVRIYSFADSIDSFVPGMEVSIRSKKRGFSGEASTDSTKTTYTIERVSPHKKGVLLMFEGVDRDCAETLIGSEVLMRRDTLPELEADTYYWQDLIGLTVVDIRHGTLGELDHIVPTGSNDVYVVKKGDQEVLVPALARVVRQVDFDEKKMVVDLPDGLLP